MVWKINVIVLQSILWKSGANVGINAAGFSSGVGNLF